jgi:hypothetical protein
MQDRLGLVTIMGKEDQHAAALTSVPSVCSPDFDGGIDAVRDCAERVPCEWLINKILTPLGSHQHELPGKPAAVFLDKSTPNSRQ